MGGGTGDQSAVVSEGRDLLDRGDRKPCARAALGWVAARAREPEMSETSRVAPFAKGVCES